MYTDTVRQTLPIHSLYTVWAVHPHSPTDCPYTLPVYCVGCTRTQSERHSLYTPFTLCGMYTNTVQQTLPVHWDVHRHSPTDTPYTLPLHFVGCTPTQSDRHSLNTPCTLCGLNTDTVRQTLPVHCVGCTPTQSDRLSLYTPRILCGLYRDTVRKTVPVRCVGCKPA